MSLRARLLVGMAVVGVVLVVAALVITRTHRVVPGRAGRRAARRSPTVGAGRRVRPRRETAWRLRRPWTTSRTQNTSLYVGAVVERRGGLRHDAVLCRQPTRRSPAVDADQVVDSAGNPATEPFTVGTDPPSDTRYRVLASRGRVGETYVAALSLADVDASVSRLIWVEVIITGLVLGLLGLVTWWVIRLGVRPVKQMTATATAIAAGDLSHRVPVGHEGTEAGELGDALNTMLTRIEEAFDERSASEARLRQFIADASHELRTPVATDPRLRRAVPARRARGARGAAAGDAAHRGRDASHGLADRRPPAARPPRPRTSTRAGAGRSRCAGGRRRRRCTGARTERRVTASVSEGVVVNGDEHRLRQLVANLVATRSSTRRADAPIEARVRSDNGSAVLEVHDDGPGMSPDVAARAFERFYRADPSRSRHHGGSGLGLAIVRAIVDAHGGTVTLDTALGRGTTVRVQLPRLDVSTF